MDEQLWGLRGREGELHLTSYALSIDLSIHLFICINIYQYPYLSSVRATSIQSSAPSWCRYELDVWMSSYGAFGAWKEKADRSDFTRGRISRGAEDWMDVARILDIYRY